jgi:hypothetical protein
MKHDALEKRPLTRCICFLAGVSLSKSSSYPSVRLRPHSPIQNICSSSRQIHHPSCPEQKHSSERIHCADWHSDAVHTHHFGRSRPDGMRSDWFWKNARLFDASLAPPQGLCPVHGAGDGTCGFANQCASIVLFASSPFHGALIPLGTFQGRHSRLSYCTDQGIITSGRSRSSHFSAQMEKSWSDGGRGAGRFSEKPTN